MTGRRSRGLTSTLAAAVMTGILIGGTPAAASPTDGNVPGDITGPDELEDHAAGRIAEQSHRGQAARVEQLLTERCTSTASRFSIADRPPVRPGVVCLACQAGTLEADDPPARESAADLEPIG